MAVRFADEIIVLSRNVQDYFRQTYGRETVWIPNGVTRPQIVLADAIVGQFGLKKHEYILYLGRLVPEKGAHYLIEAFRGTTLDKKLVIAGGVSDSGDYAARLKTLAGDDPRIVFTDFVQGQTLDELYSNAYIYVMPSDVEGMPLTLLEAMSYGCCCLVSDIPECTEVVEDKAIIFRHGQIAALGKELEALCGDPETVKRYQNQAQDHVCNKYRWDDVVEKTLELYQ